MLNIGMQRREATDQLRSVGIHELVLSPDGRRLVITEEMHNKPSSDGSYHRTGRVISWYVPTRQKLWQIENVDAGATDLGMIFAPDGRSVLWSNTDRTTILDTATGHILGNWPRDGRGATFSHQGDTIAALGEGKLLLYDLHTGKLQKEWPISEAYARLGFSPDDTQLVVGGASGQITVIDLETGRERLRLRGHSSQVEEIVISRDNRRIVSVAETARLWYATRPRMGHIFKSASPRDSAKWVSFIPTTRTAVESPSYYYIEGFLAGRSGEFPHFLDLLFPLTSPLMRPSVEPQAAVGRPSGGDAPSLR